MQFLMKYFFYVLIWWSEKFEFGDFTKINFVHFFSIICILRDKKFGALRQTQDKLKKKIFFRDKRDKKAGAIQL